MRKLLWLAAALIAMPATAQQPVYTPDLASTLTTFDGANDEVVLALNGRAGAAFQVKTANLEATLTFYASYDGSVTWNVMNLLTLGQQDSGASTKVIASADAASSLLVPSGATHIKAKVTAHTSGTGTIRLTATLARVALWGIHGSGTLNYLPKFTPDTVTLGNSTVTDDGTVVTVNGATTMRAAADATGNAAFGFLDVTGTLPPAYSLGSYWAITSNVAGTSSSVGLSVDLLAGSTANSYSAAGYFSNSVNPSGTSPAYGLYAVASGSSPTKIGLQADGLGGTTSTRGVFGTANSGSGYQIGGDFRAYGAGTKIGIHASLSSTLAITAVDTAALFDNNAIAAPIAIFRDNGNPVLTVGDSTTVTGATTIKGAATNVDYFLKISGALAATTTSTGVLIETTTSGIDAGTRTNFASIMGAGYAGAGQTILSYVDNQASGSGGNIGTVSYSSGAGAGTNTGVYGAGFNSTVFNQGVLGLAYNSSAGANIGGQFRAVNPGAGTQTGLYAGLNGTTPTFVSAAFIADNADKAAPIALFRDNDVTKVSIEDGGKVLLASGNYIEGTEAAAPAAPAAGQVILYAKSGAPGEFCSKDDGGTETCMSAGSGGSGLTHPQVMVRASYGGF